MGASIKNFHYGLGGSAAARDERVEEITPSRRCSDRVAVPQGSALQCRAWIVTAKPNSRALPNAAQIQFEARDLGAGGIGGIWKRRRTGPETIVAGLRLRLEIERGRQVTMVDGRIAFTVPMPEPGCKRIGIQFLLDATNVDDCRKSIEIDALMAALRIEEVSRRKRAG